MMKNKNFLSNFNKKYVKKLHEKNVAYRQMNSKLIIPYLKGIREIEIEYNSKKEKYDKKFKNHFVKIISKFLDVLIENNFELGAFRDGNLMNENFDEYIIPVSEKPIDTYSGIESKGIFVYGFVHSSQWLVEFSDVDAIDGNYIENEIELTEISTVCLAEILQGLFKIDEYLKAFVENNSSKALKKINESIFNIEKNPIYDQFLKPYKEENKKLEEKHKKEKNHLDRKYKKNLLYIIEDILNTLNENEEELGAYESNPLNDDGGIWVSGLNGTSMYVNGFLKDSVWVLNWYDNNNANDSDESKPLSYLTADMLSHLLEGLLEIDEYMKIYNKKYSNPVLKQINK